MIENKIDWNPFVDFLLVYKGDNLKRIKNMIADKTTGLNWKLEINEAKEKNKTIDNFINILMNELKKQDEQSTESVQEQGN